MGKVTFDEIMRTLEREQVGTVVRNCLPGSVKEAQEAATKHPTLKLDIFKDPEHGTCIVIMPRGSKITGGAQAIWLKGNAAVAAFFRKRK